MQFKNHDKMGFISDLLFHRIFLGKYGYLLLLAMFFDISHSF